MTARIEPTLWEHPYTGHPNQVAGWLPRSLGQYTINYNRFYVGRTQDPWTRMRRHRDAWRAKRRALYHMIEIYKTKSFANMVQVEAKVIAYLKGRATRGNKKMLNKAHGDWQESDNFYLYLLVDDGTKKSNLSTEVDDTQMIDSGLASSKMGDIEKLIDKNSQNQTYNYVGFTDNPKVRFQSHQTVYAKSESWSKMVVLFKGKNLSDTFLGENSIIRYTRGKYGDDFCLNASFKHEPASNEYYYVYVLLGNK